MGIDKKFIDIGQVRDMITYANKTTYNDNKKIVLVDNVEYLNVNSVNALLKILEEPNSNMLFARSADCSPDSHNFRQISTLFLPDCNIN